MEYLHDVAQIVEAILVIMGGLKIIARYTKWQWDDKALELAEKPLQIAFSFIKPKKD